MDDRQLELWGKGIGHEIAFWEHWLATNGDDKWPENFAQRQATDTPLDSFLVDILGDFDPKAVKILDVGAGPISKLGKVYKGVKLDIIACDPLADYYAAIRDKHGVTPPIRTIKGFAEDLVCFFPSDHFDLVTCTNALDHSIEPLRGIVQMLEVIKPGRNVVLQHTFNEAERNKYHDFHQWNFDLQEGRFIIWNRNYRIDVAEALEQFATVKAWDGGYMTAVITKQGPVSLSELIDPRARVTELLDVLMAKSRVTGNEARANEKLQAAKEKLEATKNKFQAAKKRNAELAARLAALHKSLSWRLTKPVRVLSRILRSTGVA